jgi:hypothetical protein
MMRGQKPLQHTPTPPCKAYDIAGDNQRIAELIKQVSTKSFDKGRFVEIKATASN